MKRTFRLFFALFLVFAWCINFAQVQEKLEDPAPITTSEWVNTQGDQLLATLLFSDDFESGLGNWTITNEGGICVWVIYAPPYPNTYTLPCGGACDSVLAADSDDCGSGTTLLSTAYITNPINATLYQTVWIEFDNDWNAIDAQDSAFVEVSTNGTTWTAVITWNGTDVRNTHENVSLTSLVALSNFYVRFRSVQPGWDWWWVVDNVQIFGDDIIPVELSSFTANVNNGKVELNWITSTETNNQGFEVQRSSTGEDFGMIGYVAGYGTTTEPKAYTFIDESVGAGEYSYRLKQIDLDGSFEYSQVIEVDVPVPAEFSLGQNYPNPFNPVTKINFSIAADSKVMLKIFDILGQEVATLFNGELSAGEHQLDFNASGLNSGVYIYRLDAAGVNGKNFSSVKKMILSK